MSTWLNALSTPSITNQPPTEGELRRIDIAVIVTVIFALFLGFGIRNNARTASRSVGLGEGLPTINIPNNWISGTPEGTIFHARNPRSPSTFNTEVTITTRPLAAGEDAVAARTAIGLKRTQELLRYRELRAQPVTVNGQAGILVTYAYVADPTREQGAIAPPVVVQAQDLIFPSGANQALIVTVAADAAAWDEEAETIEMIWDSLGMRIQESTLDTQLEGTQSEEGGQ